MNSLPNLGATNWGGQLNNYLRNQQNEINNIRTILKQGGYEDSEAYTVYSGSGVTVVEKNQIENDQINFKGEWYFIGGEKRVFFKTSVSFKLGQVSNYKYVYLFLGSKSGKDETTIYLSDKFIVHWKYILIGVVNNEKKYTPRVFTPYKTAMQHWNENNERSVQLVCDKISLSDIYSDNPSLHLSKLSSFDYYCDGINWSYNQDYSELSKESISFLPQPNLNVIDRIHIPMPSLPFNKNKDKEPTQTYPESNEFKESMDKVFSALDITPDYFKNENLLKYCLLKQYLGNEGKDITYKDVSLTPKGNIVIAEGLDNLIDKKTYGFMHKEEWDDFCKHVGNKELMEKSNVFLFYDKSLDYYVVDGDNQLYKDYALGVLKHTKEELEPIEASKEEKEANFENMEEMLSKEIIEIMNEEDIEKETISNENIDDLAKLDGVKEIVNEISKEDIKEDINELKKLDGLDIEEPSLEKEIINDVDFNKIEVNLNELISKGASEEMINEYLSTLSPEEQEKATDYLLNQINNIEEIKGIPVREENEITNNESIESFEISSEKQEINKNTNEVKKTKSDGKKKNKEHTR